MYGRFLESITWLFIPLYDELNLKSLVLLFLILTRARPYTRTLDPTLELLLMIGDFLLNSTYPLHLALRWWHKQFGVHYEPLETELDTQGEPQAELDAKQPETATVQSPPKVVSETLAVDQQQLSNSPRSYNSRPRFSTTTHDRNPEASSSTHPKKETRRQRTVPSSQKDSKVATSTHSRERRRGEASFRPQIWYPPRSSPLSPASRFSRSHQQQLDEWRQYPPFPSTYPPTPLVTSRLAAASIVRSSTTVGAWVSAIYPPIEEERSQQDFPKSLLPPREPLNSSHAGDLSDQSFTLGIPPYEDEDEFNMTPTNASSTSWVSEVSNSDDGSSLHSSSESLSPSKSIPTSIIGKNALISTSDEITNLDPLVPSGSRRRPSAAEDLQ
ncbi:hypothetical protein BYT27DRAFT_7257549 [Phlegmacium glaucopus]|nr:hypothetical protein BYT27DRAFT_7257549 [Phlegmacium glaucopus]